MSGEIGKDIAKYLLKQARIYVKSSGYSTQRLPAWIESAKIKIAKVNGTYIFLFQGSKKDRDEFVFKKDIKSDLSLFLDLENPNIEDIETENYDFEPYVTQPSHEGILLIGGGDDKERAVLNFVDDPVMFDLYNEGINPPTFLVHLFMNYIPQEEVIASGFVSFAALIHENDISFSKSVFDACRQRIEEAIDYIHNTQAGDYYEVRRSKETFLNANKKNTIIILGSYETDYKEDLSKIKDYTNTRGYNSFLIEDLPAHPSMSPQEKVNFWTSASRFTIVVDQKASGHLTEFEKLKQNRTITALLQPKMGGSTWMIGDEPQDYDFIRKFEFEDNPMEVIEDATDWAESKIEKRIDTYESRYPWRQS